MRKRTVLLGFFLLGSGLLAPAAIAAGSRHSAGLLTIDMTVACPVRTVLNSGSFYVFARVSEPPLAKGQPNPGAVGVSSYTQPQVMYGAVGKSFFITATKKNTTGYYVDRSTCKPTRAIPLSPSGLPSSGVFTVAGNEDMTRLCSVVANGTVTVRVRVVMSRPDRPVSARVAVRAGPHHRPAAFIDWTPTRFKAFVASGCLQR